MSEKNNILLILGIGLGLFAGAIFAYILFKKQSTQTLNQQPPPIINVHPIQQPPIQQPVQTPVQTPDIIYKNDEYLEIERNADGSIKRLHVIRDVKCDR